MDVKTRKKYLRKELNGIINSIPQDEVNRQSDIVTKQVLSHPKYVNAKSVSIYLSFDKEIQTEYLLQHIFKSGKTCFIPRFRSGSSEMEMIKLNSLEDYENLPVNNWNIKQPLDDEERVSVFDAGNLDLVLAPGLGFTSNGKRLGRGKGYYDGFLTKCFKELPNRPFILGLAFKQQIKQEIPTTESDVIIDQVLFADD
ncbi:hypothetical protein L9F63_026786 [Diploptera punctata]|uniref:5-formyltetrahydrofolate cyclo-ligase n=1 Tax=Diploptera punctata TaxID=6984 RepID=A0AAD8EQA4_DIPPU|nr:hypothetical protein L9F63_026786 [Diploptera punctata]